jgi:acetyltransferase-like isoleucine patch superfamily enzyme
MIGSFTKEELLIMGFASIGENVSISKTSTLYNCKNISIGNHVRIDNFCTIAPSGNAKLTIGNYVQISAYSFVNGMGDVTLEDFVTFAPYVRLFSSSDDYSGKTLTNATIPHQYLGTITKPILLKKHSIIGVGSSIMPGVTLGEATAVAGHSFVNQSSEPFTIIGGVPARYIKKRSRILLEKESLLKSDET